MNTNLRTISSSHLRNVCPECNDQFTLKATLKSHLLSKHNFSKAQIQDLYLKVADNIDGASEPGDIPFQPSYKCSRSVVSEVTSSTDDSGNFDGVHPGTSQSTDHNLTSLSVSLNCTNYSGKWRCDECGKTFDAQNKLKQHQEAKNHTGVSTAVETDGNETDTTLIPGKFEEDDTGYETERTLNTKSNFHCHLCNKSFETAIRLNQHNNSEGHKHKMKQLNAENVSGATKLFPCNLEDCGRKFDSEVKLLQHQGMKHGIKVGVVNIDGNESGSLDFHCGNDACDKAFATKAQLLQHVRDKHPAGKSNSSPIRQLCQYCDEFNETAVSKPFIFLTFIAKHILTEHEKTGYVKGTCPICQARVEKQKNLLTHISRSHLFNKFKDEACFICLRLCKDKADLLQHSTSVHRFKCAIDSCHSMFPSKPLRDKHMLDKHSVYGCGMETCQRIFPTLEDKIKHMREPHKGEVSQPVIACLRGLANVHEGGAMSEPSAFYPVSEQSPVHHVRNSADESFMRSTDATDSDLLTIHRILQERVEDLTAFIDQFSSQLSQFTNPSRSEMTFEKCNDLKYAIEGIQRRLNPRID